MKKFVETNSVNSYSVLTDTGFKPISNLHTTIPYEIWKVSLNNDTYNLKCADNHILFLEDYTEIFVKDLEVGYKVWTKTGLHEVTSLHKTHEFVNMYDLEIDDENHRYYTNDILSHNTQLAKEINEYLFGSEDNLIRVDMSEYMEPHSVSKLIGSPPGYVGYDEGGHLTEQVRRKPHSVVLFDEIEKAHPVIFNVMLQMLDDGHLTDSLGRHIDFRNCLIIMTSNSGSKQVEEFGAGVGFGSPTMAEQANREKETLHKALKKRFSPEFLNRIDEIVIFNKLGVDIAIKILDKECKDLAENLAEIGDYGFKISKSAKEVIIAEGYDDRYGARQIRRTLERLLEDKISEMILRGDIKKGDVIKVNAKDNNLTISAENK